ncbi:ABC transporter ATP-binding protein/permease [Peptoniphilus sp. MSJ-1]|uniref:ABC transporter ATP-binding protein/permease n=1 Tax=Peptoniphilus ovalis TaxID=2841503 RepID=A0ABS6FJ32_9FIRM|nr:ABC transporter ATP-binding protein [Peptoniphilus ovalis]MBU5669448.1 ABC transporter ATP-binding protein/permease [Peptoniphilus ovalis]
MNKLKHYKYLIKELLKLVSNLKIQMICAIFFGALGHIFATLIPGLGGLYLAKLILKEEINFKMAVLSIIGLGIIRAIFKYIEQLFNHYVAFKTLATIRDKVFKKLRELSPAKMQEKNKGELISIITADIELLEVFYAHTISPVCIALIHSFVFFMILLKYSYIYSLILLLFHLILAIIVPIITEKSARNIGKIQRGDLSRLNSKILETFKGLKEIINYNYEDKRLEEINNLTKKLNQSTKKLSQKSANNFSITSAIIIFSNFVFIMAASILFIEGKVDEVGLIFPFAIFISSFGPTSALSSLANNLVLTFACGERVLGLFNEKPVVEENIEGEKIEYDNLSTRDLCFSYDDKKLIEKFNLDLKLDEVIGLSGKSGCGKSTIIKLIMRFFDPDKGEILINNNNLKNINTTNLRDNISYTSQETHLFKGTIRENLLIAKEDATEEELIEASKKANIYEFIRSLDKGFDTEIVKENKLLSTGQIQRLALARMFLRKSKLYILDEPTANIDALNEGIILKSLHDEKKNKTIIISSHRKSSLRICDEIIKFNRGMES